MGLWKVRVDCIRKEGRTPVIRRVLVEAESSEEAMVAGAAHAENTTSWHARWTEFIAREAASVTLPLDI